MKKKLNIWFFHHDATPENMPGNPRAYCFGQELVRLGHRVTIFSGSFLPTTGENLIENRRTPFVIQHDQRVVFVFLRTPGHAGSLPGRMRTSLLYYCRLRSVTRAYLKKRMKPDIIIASSPQPQTLLAGLHVAGRLRIPCVCEVRAPWPQTWFDEKRLSPECLPGKLLLWAERWMYRRADALLFLRPGDIARLTDRRDTRSRMTAPDVAKCFCVPQGIRAPAPKPQAEIDDGTADTFRVLYIGPLHRNAHPDLLLDAAKLLRDDLPIRLEVLGEGSQAARLKKRLAQEAIANVRIGPIPDRRAIPQLLSGAALHVLPYATEGGRLDTLSRQLMGCLAAGRPVLATAPVAQDLLERYGCGQTLEAETAEALARHIRGIRALPPEGYRRLCEGARQAAAEHAFPALTGQLMDVIRYALESEA